MEKVLQVRKEEKEEESVEIQAKKRTGCMKV